MLWYSNSQMQWIRDHTAWVKNPEMVFSVLAIIFGTFSAVMVPQLIVNDENMHFLKAYDVASGSLGLHDCRYPEQIVEKAGNIYHGDFSARYDETIDVTHMSTQAGCGTAAAYSPIMHIPQAIGVFIAKLVYPSAALMVLLGRITNLLFYVFALYFIIRSIRIGKWAFVVVALIPAMIHMAGSLSADVVNNVVVFGFIAWLLHLFTQTTPLSRRQYAVTILLAICLALTKPTNTLLMIPLLFLPRKLFTRPKSHRPWPSSIYKWGVLAIIGIIAISIVLGWQYVSQTHIASDQSALWKRPLSFLRILFNTYANPFIDFGDKVFRGTVGEFSSYQYHLPIFMVVLNYIVLFVVFLKRDAKERLDSVLARLPTAFIFFATYLVVIAGVSYALYLTWAVQPYRLGSGGQYADGVQGRYLTPFLLLIIPLALWLRRFFAVQFKSQAVLGWFVLITTGSLLTYYCATTLSYILR